MEIQSRSFKNARPEIQVQFFSSSESGRGKSKNSNNRLSCGLKYIHKYTRRPPNPAAITSLTSSRRVVCSPIYLPSTAGVRQPHVFIPRASGSLSGANLTFLWESGRSYYPICHATKPWKIHTHTSQLRIFYTQILPCTVLQYITPGSRHPGSESMI